VAPFMSSASGLDFSQTGPLTPEARRLGDDMMLRSGGLTFNSILPREGTLDFLKPMNMDVATVKGLVDSWSATHPGAPMPPELANLAGAMGLKTDSGAGALAPESQPGGERPRVHRTAHRDHGDGEQHGHERAHGHGRGHGRGHGHGRGEGHGHHRRHGRGDHGHHKHHGSRGHRRGGQDEDESGENDRGSDAGRAPEGRDRGEAPKPEGTTDQRAQKIMGFLQKDLGLTKAQAAGVVGNFLQESATLNPGQGGDNGHALGIAQWNGPRKHGLFQFAKEHGGNATSLDTQLQYLKHELTHGESKSLAALKRTSTPEQAALTFQRTFERAGNPMNGNRVRNARMAYNRYGSTEVANNE
jgi:hypothetical protein